MNAAIHHSSSLLKDKQGRIVCLQDQNDASRCNQGGLKASIHAKATGCDAVFGLISDRNAKLNVLNHDIDHNLCIINDLKRKIADASDATFVIHKDNDHYAARNYDLNATVAHLRARLEDGEREIVALRRNLDELNHAYHHKEHDNELLERNILSANDRIGHLSHHHIHIGSDVSRAADREMWLKGNHCGASHLLAKKRDYEDQVRYSAHHVDHVRSNSPARSPVRSPVRSPIRRYY